MAGSTYSTNLKIELMTTGENSGTWGDITNTNLGTALEQAVVGYGNVDYVADANLTISITNSNASQPARALVLNVTSTFGSLTQTRELVVPTSQKQYIVQNNTTGGQSITVKTSAGTGITVPNGRKAHLYVNGTSVIQMFDFINILGGTIDNTTLGATTASSARVTTLNASGATTLDGTVALGNAAGDLITVPGTINSSLLFTDNTYDIGASGATRPRNLFLAGAATIGGNLSVGGTLTLTGGVNLNGNVTVGDSAADTLTINSTVTSNLIFTDNTYDIGASGATRPRNLFLAGNATIGGAQTLTGALTVDSTTDSSSTTTGSIQTDGGVGIAKALFVGNGFTVAGSGTINLGATTGSLKVNGYASGSANLVLQSDSGTGVAYWLSAKTSGILAIGGNGGSEPSLGAINIGSTGNVSVGATAGSGLFQVGTPGSSTGSLRAFSSYVSVDANYQSANVYGTAALPALIFGGDDNTGIWHPASDVIAFSNAGGETARFDASKNFVIGATATNGKLTVYNGQVGGLATTLSPVSTIWMDYAGAVGDNRGSGPSFVFSSSNAPSNLGKSAAIGAPSADSGGLSRIVDLSFWTSAFDANRAEVGRFTGNGGNFLIGKTAGYGVNEANTVQAKGAIVWAADNTASADNRNWLASVNGSSNGSWDLVNSSANNNWPNSAYILSVTRSGQATLGYGDMIIGGPVATTTRMFRAYEVGTSGNNAGFSCGAAGAKGSIWGASGASGLFIAAGSGHGLNFGYAAGDSSLYANFNYLGVWNTTGLGIGTSSPQVRLTLRTTHQAPTGTTFTGAVLIHDEPNGVVPHLGAGVAYDGGGNYSWIQSNSSGGTYPLVLNGAGGNVGVGLKIPARALDVAGTIRLTSNPADLNYLAEIYSSYNSAHPFQLDVKNNGTTFEMWGMYAASGGGSERISSPSLDVAIGVTDTTGSLSNDKGVVAGRFRSFVGSVVQSGGGGWYDAFTIVNTGMYIVHAYIGGYNAGPSDWSNGWFISYTGSNNAYVGTSVFGATGNIQCQRKTGTATTFQLYLGAGVGIGYTYVLQRIG